MMTSLKIQKKKKAHKNKHINMSTNQTRKMNQVIALPKNQDQNDQEDATIKNDDTEKFI